MTASTRPINVAVRREVEPINAARKRNAVAALCVFAFIAWCAMPALVWLVQVGLSASAVSDARSSEPLRPATSGEGQLR